MSRTLRRTLGLFAVTAASALAVPGAASAAEAFYGVTQDNRLVTFQSDNVTNVEPSHAITGLPGGENIVGLDVRPLNGQLYAPREDEPPLRHQSADRCCAPGGRDAVHPRPRGSELRLRLQPDRRPHPRHQRRRAEPAAQS